MIFLEQGISILYLYGIDAIWKIGFTGISNASASKYPINSMQPRANIKEPEPEQAKSHVCNSRFHKDDQQVGSITREAD